MTPERWRTIDRVCQDALVVDPAHRRAFIVSACGDDESLRDEVESLLACREDAVGFLEKPAIAHLDQLEARDAFAAGERPTREVTPRSSAPATSRHELLLLGRSVWVWLCAMPVVVVATALYWVALTGVEPIGWFLRPVPSANPVVDREVRMVTPGSPAALGGLLPGDIVDGGSLESFLAHLEPGAEHLIVAQRAGTRIAVPITARTRTLRDWWSPAGRVRILVLLTAALYLALAAVLLFSRRRDRTVRWGAALITQIGLWILVTAVNGHRLAFVPEAAAALRALPSALGLIVVAAMCVSTMAPASAFGFCTAFPRPASVQRSTWVWLGVAAASTVFVHIDHFWLPIYTSRPTPSWVYMAMAPCFAAGAVYLGRALALLFGNYRRLEDSNERRRIRIVAIGFGVTLMSFPVTIVLAAPWQPLEESRGSWIESANVCLYAVAPICTAYAILRHRVFDIHVIIRMGLRYAVARGLLLSFGPAAGAVLLGDIVTHRDQPIAAILATRGVLYLALGLVAVVLHALQKSWLEALDRRFFRERYDARRVLRNIGEGLLSASGFDEAARHVIARIEGVLHPESAAVLVRRPGESVFHPVAAVNSIVSSIPVEDASIALARVTRRPVDLPLISDASLPQDGRWSDTGALRRARIEWVFPVLLPDTGPQAVLLLGPKRSEEPYSSEDVELLETVTSSLALVFQRPAVSPTAPAQFGECRVCGTCWDTDRVRCPDDGSALVTAGYSRVLAGRYRLERRLGGGGMGTVYLAFDLELEREVAAKLIRQEWLGSPDAVGRFRREARAAALLVHPNVVTVFDFGVAADGRAYLVMERLHGRTLRDELRYTSPLAWTRALAILGGVGAAVSLAHSRGLIHRDLKPENIFLVQSDGTEVAKVLDFGLAKPLMTVTTGAVTDSPSSGLLGTIAYMSPEQLQGGTASEAWDVWALSVVAFEMLAGRHPFGLDAGAISSVLDDGMPPLEACGLLPERVRRVFAHALHRNPSMRPRNARDLIAALDVT